MDALDTFSAQVTAAGRPVGDTAENLGQCVGLVEAWFDTELSPHVWGNAKDLYVNASIGYIKGTSWPAPKGAAIVLDGSWGNGAGHTQISLGGTRVLEQNNPIGTLSKINTYLSRPAGYIGWILPTNFKGVSLMDKETVEFMYLAATDQYPNDGQYAYWVGRSAKELAHALYASNEGFRYRANHYAADVAAAKASAPSGQVLAPGNYTVK